MNFETNRIFLELKKMEKEFSKENVSFFNALKRPIFDLIFCCFLWFLAAYGPDFIDLIPFHSGFFCNDPSVRLPSMPQIVPSVNLWFYVLGLVISSIIVVELICLIFIDGNFKLVQEEFQKSKLQKYILRVLAVFDYFLVSLVWGKKTKIKKAFLNIFLIDY